MRRASNGGALLLPYAAYVAIMTISYAIGTSRCWSRFIIIVVTFTYHATRNRRIIYWFHRILRWLIVIAAEQDIVNIIRQ